MPDDITAINEATVTTADNAPLTIYSINGTLVRTGANDNTSAFLYSELPRGIYIEKKKNAAHKIIVR